MASVNLLEAVAGELLLFHPDFGATNGVEQVVARIDGLRLTVTSLTFATLELGLSDLGIVALIQGIERAHFYKSMTSLRDHRIWQDVYHVPFEARLL